MHDRFDNSNADYFPLFYIFLAKTCNFDSNFGKYFLLKHFQATEYHASIFPHFPTNIKDKINWISLSRTFWAAYE